MLNKFTKRDIYDSVRFPFNHYDQKLIDTLFKGKDGIFGFEKIISKSGIDSYIIAPIYMQKELNIKYKNHTFFKENDQKTVEIMHFSLKNNDFLPLFNENNHFIFKDLTLDDDTNQLLFQILFKHDKENWRVTALNQYDCYLNGIDSPFKTYFGQIFQRKTLEFLDKLTLSNSFHDPQKDIETKILEEVFVCEIRLMLKTNHYNNVLISEIKQRLSTLNHLNKLIMYQPKDNFRYFDYIKDAKIINSHMHLSQSEILSIIGKESNVRAESIANLKQNQTNSEEKYQLPINKDGNNREINDNIQNEIPKALKLANVIKSIQSIKVLSNNLGANVQMVTTSIPKGLTYTNFSKKQDDISNALGRDISVIKGLKPNTVTFLIPIEERKTIYLSELINTKEFDNFAMENPLPICLGLDMMNKPIYKCLSTSPHLLVAGTTGSGKSVFLNSILLTLMLKRSTEEISFYIIDPKQVEFDNYQEIDNVKVITDMEQASHIFDKLVGEMERRYTLLKNAKVKTIHSYNKQNKKMPYIICVIDEYNDLIMQYDIVERCVKRLGQKARGAGIHLILATQRPDKDVINGVIKTNFPSRISFSLSSNDEYRTVFGKGIPYKSLLGRGDGVVSYTEQQEEFIRFQAPIITLDENEEMELFEQLKSGKTIEIPNETKQTDTFGEAHESDESILQLEDGEPIDHLKHIIANTGETRVKQLQQMMGIRINKVSELMKQLVDEGWLSKAGRGYQIIADDEILSIWRDE